MSSLNDLIALLLQGQAPFEDEDFRQAASDYRSNAAIKGATRRQQVNLSACLYISVKNSERITEIKVRELGGWGSRNDVLQDMILFSKGHRPASTVSFATAMPSIAALPSTISSIGSDQALQIAVHQGLGAAHKMLETTIRAEYEARMVALEESTNQRVRAAQDQVLGAVERQDAAESQRLIIERKLDESMADRESRSAEIAAAKANNSALDIQVRSLTETLMRERQETDARGVEIKELREKSDHLANTVAMNLKEHAFELDAAKNASAEQIRSLTEQVTLLTRTNAGLSEKASEATLQAARAERDLSLARSESLDLQRRIAALTDQLSAANDLNASLEKSSAASQSTLEKILQDMDSLKSSVQVVATLQEEDRNIRLMREASQDSLGTDLSLENGNAMSVAKNG